MKRLYPYLLQNSIGMTDSTAQKIEANEVNNNSNNNKKETWSYEHKTKIGRVMNLSFTGDL